MKTKEQDTLAKELAALQESLRAFRFGEAGSRSRNVREGRELRREIARIKTELSTRRIANNSKTA